MPAWPARGRCRRPGSARPARSGRRPDHPRRLGRAGRRAGRSRDGRGRRASSPADRRRVRGDAAARRRRAAAPRPDHRPRRRHRRARRRRLPSALVESGRLRTRVYAMLRLPLRGCARSWPRAGDRSPRTSDHPRDQARTPTARSDRAARRCSSPTATIPATRASLTTPRSRHLRATRAAAKAGFQIAHPRHRRPRQPHRAGHLRAGRSATCRARERCASASSTRRSSTRAGHPALRARSASSPRCSRRTRRRTCRGRRRASARRAPRRRLRLAKLLDAGARLASDPISPSSSRTRCSASTRPSPARTPMARRPGGWAPDQRLTRDEALRSFTLDAAYAAHPGDGAGRSRRASSPTS